MRGIKMAVRIIRQEGDEILKKKSSNKAYTVSGKTYTYKELYKYVCNISIVSWIFD